MEHLLSLENDNKVLNSILFLNFIVVGPLNAQCHLNPSLPPILGRLFPGGTDTEPLAVKQGDNSYRIRGRDSKLLSVKFTYPYQKCLT